MGLKMDMQKAYDKLEWGFILAVLRCFGFSAKWIKWIEQRISTVSYSILLNGSAFEHFTPERGIRQGDPLSPFLFILCLEVVSRLLGQYENLAVIHGVPVCRYATPISHLMFADDLILFFRANYMKAGELSVIMDRYCKWSGQSISLKKSSVAFSSNTDGEVKAAILNMLQLNEMKVGSKYLGFPLFLSCSKRPAFADIKDKVLGRLAGWKSRVLSQAGRTTLIKSVASALPFYHISSFLMPKTWCSELDKMFKDFWWGFNPRKQHHFTLKAWAAICHPKEMEGLGLRLMTDMNMELIAKLGWSLYS